MDASAPSKWPALAPSSIRRREGTMADRPHARLDPANLWAR